MATNLYLITMPHFSLRDFFVVAKDEAAAARMAEKQLVKWGYRDDKAVKVEFIAGDQYAPEGVGWLLT